jgi:V8-like Glu-specific endopeptidase
MDAQRMVSPFSPSGSSDLMV